MKLDTFGKSNDGVDHDWGGWSLVKDPDSLAVEQRFCASCGRREMRKAPLGPYQETHP